MKLEQRANMDYPVGICDFENYWGENLDSVEIIHFISGIGTGSEHYKARGVLVNVADKTKINNVLSFSHTNGSFGLYDYWRIRFTTESGETYKSKDKFYCSFSESDNHRVILGVNGDARTLYVAFPSSSGCSTKLKLV